MNEQEKLKAIIDLGLETTRVQDIDLLLERVLEKAREFFNADAGSIYLKQGNILEFKYTQNDTLQKRLPPGRKLIYSTFTVPVNTSSIAGYVAQSGETLNIPDVYRLKENVSYRFDQAYDELSGYRTQSMLTCCLKTHRGEIIGVLQLINAKDEGGRIVPFAKSAEPLVLHFANNAAVAIERALLIRTILLRMITMAELRDPKETGAHVNRVASYAVEIYDTWALKQGFSAETTERNKDLLRMAAMLHDVGKIAVPDAILKKPARLTDEETAVMKQHAWLGARLFSQRFSDFDEAACAVALDHHERWDGTGYPGHIDPGTGKPSGGYAASQGKRGEEIHPFGRVVSIADVYDALSSKRSYKEAWDEARVLETMREESGRQFDPEMIDAFFSSLEVIKAIAQRYPGQ